MPCTLVLGTDSLASNDSLSLWDEVRFLQQVAPGVFSSQELLAMATLGGARALRIDADTGSLESGKRADFQVLGGCNVDAGAGIEATVLARGRLEQVYLAGAPLQ